MFRLLAATIRFAFFSAFVLVLGSVIQIGDGSLSDFVERQVNTVSNTHTFQEWLNWGKTKLNDIAANVESKPQEITNTQAASESAINYSERAKLKELLRSLNSAHRK